MEANQLSTPSDRRWMAPFFTIWAGQAVSLLGSQLVQFALIWWLTRTTGSATVLATASLVGLLPQVFIGPLVGALVDRLNRRRVMQLADSFIALATLVLALLFAAGRAEIWHLYVLLFVRSLAGSFHYTAMQASTSLMVPPAHLTRIQGLNQMLNGGLNILAAPLGALLLELLNVQGVLLIDVVTAAFAVAPLFFITIPQPADQENASGSPVGTLFADLRAGMHYVLTWPGLLGLMLLATLINLVLGPAFTLLPLMVTNVFNGQALQYATLEAVSGIGVLTGGLLLGVWGGFKRKVWTSMVGLVLVAASTLGIGLAPANLFPLAVVAMFIGGLALPVTNGPLMAIMQQVVEPKMQGRVFTLLGSAASAMMPLGMIAAGPIADRFGVRTWFIAGGLVTLVMPLAMFLWPAIMRLEDGRPDTNETVVELQALPAQGD